MSRGSRHFDRLVARALDALPPEFARLLENVAVVVEEEPTADDLESVGLDPDRDELFGLYQGVPLSERDSFYDQLPDRIVIYRGPIERCCRTVGEMRREVRDTVVHELGHHFGLDEEEMPY
jgi:predicted Zn-dependent protease with MMP-like domain